MKGNQKESSQDWALAQEKQTAWQDAGDQEDAHTKKKQTKQAVSQNH